MNGNGHILLAVQHQIGQQVVVPHPHNLQHTHGDHRRLEHGQHHIKVGPDGPAAVNGRGLLYLQWNALDKSAEHKDCQPCAEAQIDNGNGVGGIELQGIGSACQRKHNHLERHNHRKNAEVINQLGKAAAHAGDVPRRHAGAQQDQRCGNNGDQQRIACALQKRIVAEGKALDIVVQCDKGALTRERKGLQIDRGVALKGVHRHQEYRDQIDKGKNRKDHRQCVVAAALALKAAFGAGFFRCLSRHYCCTSLSLVERSCRILKTATSTKKMTAFACPTPRLRALA